MKRQSLSQVRQPAKKLALEKKFKQQKSPKVSEKKKESLLISPEPLIHVENVDEPKKPVVEE